MFNRLLKRLKEGSLPHIINGYEFFEYYFTSKRFRKELEGSGFEIVEQSLAFPEDGILQIFGNIVGFYDFAAVKPKFNLLGRFLLMITKRPWMLHNVAVVRKK